MKESIYGCHVTWGIYRETTWQSRGLLPFAAILVAVLHLLEEVSDLLVRDRPLRGVDARMAGPARGGRGGNNNNNNQPPLKPDTKILYVTNQVLV